MSWKAKIVDTPTILYIIFVRFTRVIDLGCDNGHVVSALKSSTFNVHLPADDLAIGSPLRPTLT